MSGPTIRRFGVTAAGAEVLSVTLENGGLRVTILTLGAILNDLRLAGVPWPLTLGSPTLAAYEGPMRYFGAIVGPVANRIAGAEAEIGGRRCRFDANEGGTITLHGGGSGTDLAIWQIAECDRVSLRLELPLPDGLGGFPGQRRIAAEYQLGADQSLSLRLTCVTDAPTLMNLANHSYWNLDGSADISGHRLTIAARRYTEVDEHLLPTGRLLPVEGNRFDLTAGRILATGRNYDHNFCLADDSRDLAEAAVLTGSRGVTMRLATTAPGLQVYDGAGLATSPFLGHTGQPYGPNAGIALEPQHWPDAPHHPAFPSILLLPDHRYEQLQRLRFSRQDA